MRKVLLTVAMLGLLTGGMTCVSGCSAKMTNDYWEGSLLKGGATLNARSADYEINAEVDVAQAAKTVIAGVADVVRTVIAQFPKAGS